MEAISVLRKLRILMMAPKGDKKGCMRVLKRKHRSAHPGADRGGVRRGRGQQRISCKLLKLLTQGKPAS